MKVCVYGLWHLGCVTAACLASKGIEVIGLDPEDATVNNLNQGHAPIAEPGLDALIQENLQKGQLTFSSDFATALSEADLVWVTFDTPVDEEDNADTGFVLQKVEQTFPYLKQGSLVLLSSQVPVGSTNLLENKLVESNGGKKAAFAYSPENLRLGKAIEVFLNPGRFIVGVSDEESRNKISNLLKPFDAPIIWMSIPSAEMTKHAINAFLATSVTFINEIASICEKVGADAKEVERGLKSEPRIGPKAYVRAGAAFAGGTLARDVRFLTGLAKTNKIPSLLLDNIWSSNQEHKTWLNRKLRDFYSDLSGKTVAILGLTYKPGTDTLRGSTAVTLSKWLEKQGARVRAFDPAVTSLPRELEGTILLTGSEKEALKQSDVAIIATEWDQFQTLKPDTFISCMTRCLVLDPNRFLEENLDRHSDIEYFTVGKP